MSRYKVLDNLEKYQESLHSGGEKVNPLSEHDTLDKAVESVFADMKDAWSIVYEATVNVFCEYDNYSGDLIYHEIHLGTAKTYDDAMSKLPEWIKEFKSGSNEFDEWGDECNLEINIRGFDLPSKGKRPLLCASINSLKLNTFFKNKANKARIIEGF